jgi:hypothetical protein
VEVQHAAALVLERACVAEASGLVEIAEAGALSVERIEPRTEAFVRGLGVDLVAKRERDEPLPVPAGEQLAPGVLEDLADRLGATAVVGAGLPCVA